MNVVSDFTWIITGKDTVTPLVFGFNPLISGMSNSNKRSIPYGSIYVKASDVVMELEGGTGAGTDVKINKLMVWDASTQTFKSYIYNTAFARWTGVDFDIKPGDCLNIYPSSAFTWTPKLAITPVP